MNTDEQLETSFEAHRDHLRGVAYRMLGSVDESNDALQQAWLRADQTDLSRVDNLAGWLTTVTPESASTCFAAVAGDTKGRCRSTLPGWEAP